MLDPYYLLGVSLTATPDEIRAAYRRRAAEIHPDRQPPDKRASASEQMKQLNAARDLLLDARRRAEYDDKVRLEMQKAMWRARREVHLPPDSPPVYTPRRRRRLSGVWFFVWVMLVCLLIMALIAMFALSTVQGDPDSPLMVLASFGRCVGSLFITGLVVISIASFLTSLTQSLRN